MQPLFNQMCDFNKTLAFIRKKETGTEFVSFGLPCCFVKSWSLQINGCPKIVKKD